MTRLFRIRIAVQHQGHMVVWKKNRESPFFNTALSLNLLKLDMHNLDLSEERPVLLMGSA